MTEQVEKQIEGVTKKNDELLTKLAKAKQLKARSAALGGGSSP